MFKLINALSRYRKQKIINDDNCYKWTVVHHHEISQLKTHFVVNIRFLHLNWSVSVYVYPGLSGKLWIWHFYKKQNHILGLLHSCRLTNISWSKSQIMNGLKTEFQFFLEKLIPKWSIERQFIAEGIYFAAKEEKLWGLVEGRGSAWQTAFNIYYAVCLFVFLIGIHSMQG